MAKKQKSKKTYSLGIVVFALMIPGLSWADIMDTCANYASANAEYKAKIVDQVPRDPLYTQQQAARAAKKACMVNMAGMMGELTSTVSTGFPLVNKYLGDFAKNADSATCSAISSAANSALNKVDSTVGGMTGGLTRGMVSGSVSGVASGDPTINTNGIFNRAASNATSAASGQVSNLVSGAAGSSSNPIGSIVGNSASSTIRSSTGGVGSSINSSVSDAWNSLSNTMSGSPAAGSVAP